MPTQTATTLRDGEPFFIGKWLVGPTLNRLTLGGTSVQLEHKAMDVLLCLVEHAGEVVSKSDLLDAVWQTEFVSDNTLQGRVAEIRDALGDNAQNPTFIETIRKRGYRLIAEIGIPDLDHPASVSPESPPQPDDERNPYPGLSAFTEAETDVFFGREKEIATLWRKITSRRLLAVIGPSGIGKSSLLRAGVATRAPPGWRVLVFTPGEDPAMSLARALAPDHAGDPSAVSRLVGFNDPDTALAVVSRWRGQFAEVVLVVDQFEELFTLNPTEVQASFVALLRRLVDAADVHVVLAMRDDFLYQCQRFPEIAPIFDGLSPLGAPNSEALRRAITEPAARLMHRFESEILVDRMIAEVEDQRGALPLLAFAVRRLWEKRDRDQRVLTEEAYDTIGGVAGALARHAEAVMGEIGHERLPVVREIFRNLVTAEGTRAVREIDELLSVFDDSGGEGIKPSPTTIAATHSRGTVGEGLIPSRAAAKEVLHKLIDARLLTTFETHDDEELSTRRVEIVHESLLANWPRLVRWQTQDADAAQLRDQLRQAARTWEEHNRTDDLLWIGSTYREFKLWRERYPGGLTNAEEAFGDAMTTFSGRSRRRRRSIMAVVVILLVAGLVIVGSFWRRSIRETLRAEAASLLSRAQTEMTSYPSAALAYATASLELSDSPEARQLALAALWQGPTAVVVSEDPSWEIAFTPDGSQLVQATDALPYRLHVIEADGADTPLEDVYNDRVNLRMASESGVFATDPWNRVEPQGMWSAEDKKILAQGRCELPDNTFESYDDLNRRRRLVLRSEDGRTVVDALAFDCSIEPLGSIPLDLRNSVRCGAAPNGRWTAVSTDEGTHVIEFGDHNVSVPRRLNEVEGPFEQMVCDPLDRFVATRDQDGRILLWDLFEASPPRVIQGPASISGLRFTRDGSMLEAFRYQTDGAETWIWSLDTEEPTLLRHLDLGKPGGTGLWGLDPVGRHIVSVLNPDPKTRLWPLGAPVDAEPVVMQRGDFGTVFRTEIHPRGQWLATSGGTGLALWPVARPYPIVIKRYEERVGDLVFGPDGRWLATSSPDGIGTVRVWHLDGEALPPGRILYQAQTHGYGLAASPDGNRLLFGTHDETVKLLSVGGEAPVDLPGVTAVTQGVAFSRDGRLAAASGTSENSVDVVIRVWNLDSLEEVAVMGLGDVWSMVSLRFADDRRLLSGSIAGLLRWNLETGDSEVLFEEPVSRFEISADDDRVLLNHLLSEIGGGGASHGRLVLFDLSSGLATPLPSHGNRVTAVAMNDEGTIAVTGDKDGVIRVGPVSGEEPHLLLGAKHEIWDLAVDPQGRWIASVSGTEVRLWPMPDLTKPPLHTLPREELIAKLKTLTNLRVVRDPESSTGWKLTHDPFPGWETVPTW